MANPLFYTEVKKIGGGDIYSIVDVQQNDVQFAKPTDNILYFGDDVAIELKKNLTSGNTITIPVATVDAKQAGFVLFEDFTINEVVGIDLYKNKKKQKVSNIFSYYLANMSGIILFNALNSFAILASKGHFITDENREDKSLEIINTGDSVLISALEDYLDAYDRISPIASMYKDMKQFEVDVEAAATEEEVDAAAHMFETAS